MDLRRNYNEALNLRLQGKTYGEIQKVFQIPKSTLSTWFKNIQLNPKARLVLSRKYKKGIVALGSFNKARTGAIHMENEKIRLDFEKQIGNLTKRELLLIGATLYWGEGYKNFGSKGYPYISFTNSDPQMILTFINFLERIFNIPREKVKAGVLIHQNLDNVSAVRYWQSLTKIPKENINSYIARSIASQGKRPKNSLPYGTLQLRVNRRQEFFKVRGLIDGIIKAV